MSPEIIAAKALFIVSLLGLIGGIYFGRKSIIWESWVDSLMLGVLWFMTLPVLILYIAFVLYGIVWVFTF